MFRKINNFLNKTSKCRQRQRAVRGQVAIVLLLIIALALIFYAVTINMGKVSQMKTAVTIASNQSASILGSLMASYGESLFQTSLGGENPVCAFNGILMAIIVVIIAIIIIIVTWGSGTPFALALIAAVVAVANLVIQIAVIQPGMSEMWNKMVADTLSTRDQFLETAIQTGLQGAVSDPIEVPDFTDMDLDNVWSDVTNPDPVDYVSRFGFYYTERLKTIVPTDGGPIENFQTALNDLLYKTTNGDLYTEFGFYDKLNCASGSTDVCCANPAPAVCNKCCLPATAPSYQSGSVRPPCCTLPMNDPKYCGPTTGNLEADILAMCSSSTPYNVGGVGYPWVAEVRGETVYWEESVNNAAGVLSFREQIGRDDQHKIFRKLAANPTFFAPPPQDLNAPPYLTPFNSFNIEDTTGFYNPPVYPQTDVLPGIFDWFYKVGYKTQGLGGAPPVPRYYNWGLDLSALDTTLVTGRPDTHCYWYDRNYHPNCTDATVIPPQELATPLTLTNQPPCGVQCPAPHPQIWWQYTEYVDGTNSVPRITGSGNFPQPLAIDQIRIPTRIPFEAADNECGLNSIWQNPGQVITPEKGFWKFGGDQFCSPTLEWPYFVCPKHGAWGTCTEDGEPVLCECGDPGTQAAEFWQDDVLDAFVYGLPDMFQWAEEVLAMDPKSSAEDFYEWYAEFIAPWIEPGWATTTPDCVVCSGEDGTLVKMETVVTEIANRMNLLLRVFPFSGATCEEDGDPANGNEVWCVPDPTTCPVNYHIPVGELATFDSQSNGIYGDFEDVQACLDWNVNDTVNVQYAAMGPPPGNMVVFVAPPGVPVTGNDEKFRTCRQTCQEEPCTILPRSMLPGLDFNPGVWVDDPLGNGGVSGNIKHHLMFLRCLNNCSVANCDPNDVGLPLAGGPLGYSYPGGPGTFPATECNPGNWQTGGGTGWYDEIAKNLARINPFCDLTNGGMLDTPGFNGWLYNVELSAREAENQVDKFEKRLDFLNNRRVEMDEIFQIFDAASQALQAFLYGPGSPAWDLMDAVYRWTLNPPGLPYQAIYGWRDKPDDPTEPAYWHIVRAEARVPGKCDGGCNTAQDYNQGDPGWPKIKTYTKGFLNSQRCYELDNTHGVVKTRVTRYDQTPQSNTILFPNGVPIWDFKFWHPARQPPDPAIDNIDWADQAGYCGYILGDTKDVGVVRGPAGFIDAYKEAFIINAYNPPLTPGANEACWKLLQKHLAVGVTSETCVKYYFSEGQVEGFDIRFVKCEPF